jgi:hypothetical protein
VRCGIITVMTAVVARRALEQVTMWRLAAAVATRWHACGALRDRHFAMLRAEDPAPRACAPEPPTVRLPSAA